MAEVIQDMIIQLDLPRQAPMAQATAPQDDAATGPDFDAVVDQHQAEEAPADPTTPWFMAPPPRVPEVVAAAVSTPPGAGSSAEAVMPDLAVTPAPGLPTDAPDDGRAAPLQPPQSVVSAVTASLAPQAEVSAPVAPDTVARPAPDGRPDPAVPAQATAQGTPTPLQRARDGLPSIIVRRIEGEKLADPPSDDSADAPGPAADVSRPQTIPDHPPRLKIPPLAPATPPAPEATDAADPLTTEPPPMQGPLSSAPSPLMGAVASAPPAPIIATLVAAASAATVSADRVEVILSPEELGRVRMDFRAEGAGVHVYLTAERQDTLDLLRRHADQLAAELRQAGYSGASLSFGRWGQQHDDGRAPQRLALSPLADARAPTPLPPLGPGALSGRGLDLRI